MPVFASSHFGPISYEPEAAVEFPRGLPGFENSRQFLAIGLPQSEPLVFLQSLEQSDLCFISVPVQVVDRTYRLRMSPEDLESIGFGGRAAPQPGEDVLCLAVLSVREDGPSANLLAPIVVNPLNHRAVQAVAPETAYSHQHSLLPAAAAAEAAEPYLCAV
jgi:flagellar assembly factor FliW